MLQRQLPMGPLLEGQMVFGSVVFWLCGCSLGRRVSGVVLRIPLPTPLDRFWPCCSLFCQQERDGVCETTAFRLPGASGLG